MFWGPKRRNWVSFEWFQVTLSSHGRCTRIHPYTINSLQLLIPFTFPINTDPPLLIYTSSKSQNHPVQIPFELWTWIFILFNSHLKHLKTLHSQHPYHSVKLTTLIHWRIVPWFALLKLSFRAQKLDSHRWISPPICFKIVAKM